MICTWYSFYFFAFYRRANNDLAHLRNDDVEIRCQRNGLDLHVVDLRAHLRKRRRKRCGMMMAMGLSRPITSQMRGRPANRQGDTKGAEYEHASASASTPASSQRCLSVEIADTVLLCGGNILPQPPNKQISQRTGLG